MRNIPVTGVGLKNIYNSGGKCEMGDIFYLNNLFDCTQRNTGVENTVGVKCGRK